MCESFARTVRLPVEDEAQWELIESALGSISDGGHQWDDDPATWVRDSRRAHLRRKG